MKYIITESQYNLLKEQEEPKVLKLPSIEYFGGWNDLQIYLEKKGNPPYSIQGDLDLFNSKIQSLGNLTSVGGDLYLEDTPIESLGNLTSVGGDLDLSRTSIESLGNLTSVGGGLSLQDTPIESLGNLTSVGGNLYLQGTPISKKMYKKEIRDKINVDGKIYLK